MSTDRGQPTFGLYLREIRKRLGFSLRKVQQLSEGRVQNAFLSQIENGHVALPNVDLLADLAQIYRLDFWNLMWRAGYRIPKTPPPSTSPNEDDTPLNIQSLEDLTEDELREVLDYADFVKERGHRRRSAST
jgi:HTH-type transcriptional regulator, competence development regulator